MQDLLYAGEKSCQTDPGLPQCRDNSSEAKQFKENWINGEFKQAPT